MGIPSARSEAVDTSSVHPHYEVRSSTRVGDDETLNPCYFIYFTSDCEHYVGRANKKLLTWAVTLRLAIAEDTR